MDLATAVRHLTAVRQYTTASYAFSVYEYFITLDREVETFWQRKFTFPTLLWFLNRYTLYFSLFPTLTGFFAPFSEEQCLNFVKFPGAMQIISNIASGLTLSLRVYALYGQAWWVIVLLAPVFVTEIALESWAVAGGTFAPLPDGEVGCILTGKEDEGIKFAAFWMGQLIFPTLIFIMTLIRAVRLRTHGTLKGGILTIMLRDGIMYFLVIFIANLANVITYIVAPVDLKFANAPFTNVITTLMICRLMLNLRRSDRTEPAAMDGSFFSFRVDNRARRIMMVGDLGEDIDISSSSDKSGKRGVARSGVGEALYWTGRDTELELDTLEGWQRRQTLRRM